MKKKFILEPILNMFPFRKPLDVVMVLAVYIIFVKLVGPNFMKNRKPLELKNVITIYNIVQIITNTYLFLFVMYWKVTLYLFNVEFQMTPLILKYGFSTCRITKPHMTEYEPIVHAHCCYLCLKLFDLIETVCVHLLAAVKFL